MAAETFRIEIPINVKDNTDPGVSSAKEKMNKFDKQNEKTQKRLNEMNKTRYQVIIDAIDKASSIIGMVSSKVRSISGKAFRFTMSVIDKATAPLRSILNFATSIQGALLGASSAFAFLYQPMKISANFEQTTMAFETLLGSAQKASSFLKDASNFANKTPFAFDDVTSSSKLLLAFGFQEKKILEMLGTIGDTSSGLSAGSEGIDRITRALGQMYAKGRVQAEELLQLQEMGVPANQILQEELGLTAAQVANIGKEGIDAATAIDGLLRGMDKRFGGMMTKQSTSALGMLSTIKDTMQNTFLRNWGEGLWVGAKPFLTEITSWLDNNQGTLEKWGEAWKEAGKNLSVWVGDKINNVRQNLKKLTSSQEWKEATTFSQKAKLVWDKIIAEPFNDWWNSTGKAWIAQKMAGIGEGIGKGITTGLLAILGIDLSEAMSDGQNVGGAFIDGFKKGFDTEKITEALKTWADNNKEVVIAIGAVVGFNLITGLASKINSLTSLFKRKGKGSNDTSGTGIPGISNATCSTMNVSANIVNVFGKVINNSDVPNINSAPKSPGGSLPQLPWGEIPRLPGGVPSLPGGSPTLGLPGGTAATGGLTSAGSWLSKLLTLGSKSSVIGADGTLLAVQGGLGGTLGSFGGALGGTATTAAGMAAIGGASIAGIIGGVLGLGSSVVDIFQGSKKSKEGDAKGAKDEYITAGTKMGMLGAGAASGAGIGAAIGAAGGPIGMGVGALIGLGVGGVGALFGGDAAGKAISDGTDEGGWLDSAWKATKNFFVEDCGKFFGETIPKGWNSFWGSIGNFFTASVPNWWNGLKDKVSTFFTETIPEKWDEMWQAIGDFFTEDVPYAVGYACGKIEIFFTETIPEFFGDLWDSISTFFTDTLPTWAGGIWNDHIVPFFTESIPEFFSGLWDSIYTFFTDTLPTWASDVWNNNIVPFFTEDIPAFFSNLWNNLVTFFTDTLPTWASDTWNNSIVPFFTEDIPTFFTGIWTAIVTFFTDTLPTWASNIWSNNIVPFFTVTIPGFFGSVWDSVTKFVTESIPNWASNIWGKISGWFSSIGDWFGSVWDKVTGFFGAGYNDAKGNTPKHAWGGIMSTPHVGMVAEAGPEAIIPLSPSKSARGLDLWMKTGSMLGVRPYADGGIVGDTSNIEDIPLKSEGISGGNNFEINVELNPEFIISGKGMDEQTIIAILKAKIREMADDIGDELAERLARIFANMPVKGGI